MTRKVTIAMLTEARELGLTVTEAARRFGVNRNTFDSAAKRANVKMTLGSPGIVPADPDDQISDARVKAWSCAPSAIARAILRHEASK